MDTGVPFTINGTTYHFTYNINAMFAAQELFGDKSITEKTKGMDKESVENVLALAQIMSEQAERVHRYLEIDSGPVFNAKEIMHEMGLSSVYEILRLKEAVIIAMSRGYNQEEVDENEEVDLGLAELNQKKTRGSSKRA